MEDVFAAVLGYLIGSVPFAFLVARRRGIDLRRAGSGNIGATNVLRTTSAAYAVLAMSLDVTKGVLAVLAASAVTTSAVAPVVAGLAAIVGHIYPPWLGFRGGKGVATAAGAFALLAPLAVVSAASVFVIVVGLTRYVSVGSLVAAPALVLVAALEDVPAPVIIGAAIATLLIAYRHRPNITRLMAGTEPRLGTENVTKWKVESGK